MINIESRFLERKKRIEKMRFYETKTERKNKERDIKKRKRKKVGARKKERNSE